MTYALRLTQAQHEILHRHLFPGDGKEAVAILLCGKRPEVPGISSRSGKFIPCRMSNASSDANACNVVYRYYRFASSIGNSGRLVHREGP